ncbi:MAG TPA: hypothetical protein VF645_13515 [Allosphingosinicella sp.]
MAKHSVAKTEQRRRIVPDPARSSVEQVRAGRIGGGDGGLELGRLGAPAVAAQKGEGEERRPVRALGEPGDGERLVDLAQAGKRLRPLLLQGFLVRKGAAGPLDQRKRLVERPRRAERPGQDEIGRRLARKASDGGACQADSRNPLLRRRRCGPAYRLYPGAIRSSRSRPGC